MKKPYPKNRDSSALRLTHEEFLEKLWKVKDKNEYIVHDRYILSQTKMKFTHIPCGTEFMNKPNIMLRENHIGCPICSQVRRANTKREKGGVNLDVIKNKVKELYPNDEYILNEEKTIYKNNKEPSIYLECSRCGLIFGLSYVNLCHGRGCPWCNKQSRQESKNVKKIKDFLNEENIEFETEFKIEACKRERVLPFDFKVEIDKKIYLIEYDGEFHDRGYNNNMESLEKVKQNDSIKTKFCKDNKIPLLRLRYNDFKDYKKRLKEFLVQRLDTSSEVKAEHPERMKI